MLKKTVTCFEHKVYSACRNIPRGKVATYKDIARAIGSKAYRTVGNALNKNPFAPTVPCHRVIRSNGDVGGFATGSSKKIRLLRKEGHKIKNGRLVELSKSLMHPIK